MPIPAMTIQDGPRYSWRGLMLDPARSFIPKNEVIKLMHSMEPLQDEHFASASK